MMEKDYRIIVNARSRMAFVLLVLTVALSSVYIFLCVFGKLEFYWDCYLAFWVLKFIFLFLTFALNKKP